MSPITELTKSFLSLSQTKHVTINMQSTLANQGLCHLFFFQSQKFIIFCYIAGKFFPTVRSPIGYFEITWHLAIDLFTDTAAILDQLDLRSIMGCLGGHLARSVILTQYLGALFGSIFLKVFLEKDCNWKKRSTYRVWDVIMIVSFPRNILFSRKPLVNTERVPAGHTIILLKSN